MFYYLLVLFVVGVSAEKFECPNENGTFPHSGQCDKFYNCRNGVATEEFCPEGLFFGDGISVGTNLTRFGKCDAPFNVDCANRTEMQTANRTSIYCKKKNGVFAHPDETICDRFFICDDGEHSETPCANGLHFEEITGTCTWPNVANREHCVDQVRKLSDGFACPVGEPPTDAAGQIIVNPHYPHPEDCEYFYVCVNRVEPRMLMCEDKRVFNKEKKTCDDAANVPGCEDWFN